MTRSTSIPAVPRSALLAFEQGTTVDHFELVSAPGTPASPLTPLGEGGSGVVFLAHQTLADDVVVQRALKFFVLRDDIALKNTHTGPISTSNFKAEIINVSQFNHQNLIKVTHAGIWTHPTFSLKIPYLVTAFAEGPTLRDILETHSLLEILNNDPTAFLDLALQLCAGVSYLHSRQFFHCDIAPKNIFLEGSSPNLNLIVGDLGIGRSATATNQSDFVLTGTPPYSPPVVRSRLNSIVSWDYFVSTQPHWDIYGLATSLDELLGSLQIGTPPWQAALRHILHDAANGVRFPTVDAIRAAIEWVRPTQRRIADVPELSDNGSDTRRSLLPITPLTSTRRLRRIIYHPAVLRLKEVPQLVLATATLPGANHTRYEHSLGVYQNMRRYLLALLDNVPFLAAFDRSRLELALLSALLSNVMRYPFSSIIDELRTGGDERFDQFNSTSIYDEVMTSRPRRVADQPLCDTIAEHFPDVDLDLLKRILTGVNCFEADTAVRFIYFLLNSSLDCRVLDYLQRDSLHIGMTRSETFDIGELLPHVEFDDGRLLVRSSALSVVEQIVALRYWLFSRMYWNMPNRAIISTIRMILRRAADQDPSFPQLLRRVMLKYSEPRLIRWMRTRRFARPIREMVELLMEPRPRLYKEVAQFNRVDDDATARCVCDRMDDFSAAELEDLRAVLDNELRSSFSLDGERIHVLIDIPIENGRTKLGEDLNVRLPSGAVVPLERVSGIASGAFQGFTANLQRVRVFLHPETIEYLDENRMTDKARTLVRELTRARCA